VFVAKKPLGGQESGKTPEIASRNLDKVGGGVQNTPVEPGKPSGDAAGGTKMAAKKTPTPKELDDKFWIGPEDGRAIAKVISDHHESGDAAMSPERAKILLSKSGSDERAKQLADEYGFSLPTDMSLESLNKNRNEEILQQRVNLDPVYDPEEIARIAARDADAARRAARVDKEWRR
jgi:hypothetical protein